MNSNSEGFRGSATNGWRILLGGWRDILDDLQDLGRALQRTPDACECGPGTCACCGTPTSASRPHCVECEVLVHTLGWRVEQLFVDAIRFYPAFEQLVRPKLPESERDRLDALRRQIHTLATVLQRVQSAWPEFQKGCRTTHLASIKELGKDLLESALALDDIIDPGDRSRRSRGTY